MFIEKAAKARPSIRRSSVVLVLAVGLDAERVFLLIGLRGKAVGAAETCVTKEGGGAAPFWPRGQQKRPPGEDGLIR